MTWKSVGRKDFRDSLRSRWLWAVTVLFVVIFSVLPVRSLVQPTGPNIPNTDQYAYLMKQVTAALVPITSIVIGYAAVTGERESGTLKLMLSLPHSREDVVLGKVLGRSGVVGVSILIGFFVAAIILLISGLHFLFVDYILFALLTLLYGLVFVGLSVGISAAAKTGRRAMAASISLYIVFLVLWSTIAKGIGNVLTGNGMGFAGKTQVVLFIRLFNPMTAYKTLVDTILLSNQHAARVVLFNRFIQSSVNQVLRRPLPLYFSDAAVIIYLLFWLFIPVAIGYSVFDRAEL